MCTKALLDGLERPLLCSSMHIEGRDGEEFELPDAMSLMESYSLSGIDFMVDAGRHVAEESTVGPWFGALLRNIEHHYYCYQQTQ